MFDISAIQIAIVLVIALLVFGPKRLPDMARMLGKGIRDFKSTMESSGRADEDEDEDEYERPEPEKAQVPVSAAFATESAPPDDGDDDLAGMIVPGGQRPDPPL
jgi:sec-independent protein translocase protein TatA